MNDTKTVKIDAELHRDIKVWCSQHDCSIAEFVNEALIYAIYGSRKAENNR